MAMTHDGGVVAPSIPYADHVRRIDADQPFNWLAAGWRDFTAAPAASIGYGLIFVAIGIALAFGLWRANQLFLLLPLASGFMLLGPVLMSGFYAMSRDLEQGRRPSISGALLAWRTNAGPVFYGALAFMFLFLVWLRFSEVIFALAFPAATAELDAQGLLNTTFFTIGGLEFLALFLALGAAMAALAFAGGAFAFQMLLDRQVSASEALATSFAATVLNMRAMAVWAALLVALVVGGMAVFFVGLAVTLPLAGHASWHAYRAVIRPESRQ
jgi:uncharacterized membrane protein